MAEPTPGGEPTPDLHLRMLQAVFKKERIMTESFAVSGDVMRQSLTFPAFEKTVRPLDHASHVQINEALLEGLYGVMAALRTGALISEEPFVETLKAPHTARIVRQETAFEREIHIGDSAEFVYQLESLVREEEGEKHRYRVVVSVSGPSTAEFECLITPRG